MYFTKKAEKGGNFVKNADKIAICDDEQSFITEFKEQLSELATEMEYTVTEYKSGEALLSKHTCGKYDIILLDIEMGEINGIETARLIRETDKDVSIAFLTNYSSFALEGYSVRAERYILKNQPKQLYKEQLSSLLMEYDRKHTLFRFTSSGTVFAARLSDILYFEVYIRKIYLHTADSDKPFEFYGKLSKLEEEYSSHGFVRAGKSYLINISKIKLLEKDSVIMKNGASIPLPRSARSKVADSYLKYLSGR